MIKYTGVILAVLLTLNSFAQNVAINETGAAADPSAILDVSSPDKGILIPRINDHNTVPTPATGLLVYDTVDDTFWYFDGAQWLPLLSTNSGWRILGNDLTDANINFLGTTDAQAMMFRANNTAAGRLDYDALVSGSALGTKGVTALGLNALSSNSSGYYNSAFGYGAGSSVTNGRDNTFVGYNSGNATNGIRNTLIGSQAGAAMTTGPDNVVIGAEALRDAPSAFTSVWIGSLAGQFSTGGSNNVVMGHQAGRYLESSNNVLLGHEAGANVTTGDRNVYIGWRAGIAPTAGSAAEQNVIIGYQANADNLSTIGPKYGTIIGYQSGRYVSGFYNTMLGYRSGFFLSTGVDNTYVGREAGYGTSQVAAASAGNANSFFGSAAGRTCSAGCGQNVALGADAGRAISSGAENVYIGFEAGFNSTSGSRNVYIGRGAGAGVTGYTGAASDRFLLANSAGPTAVLMSGNFSTKRVGINTTAPTQTLSVNGDADKVGGGTWLAFSDRRVKEDIRSFNDGLNVLMHLEPVRFRYNDLSGYAHTGRVFVGFIAQDVEKVAPYMVSLLDDSDGPSGYDDKRVFDETALTKILVNAVKEQQEQIEALESRIERLEELILSGAASTTAER